jgi:hypothetical protein
MFPISLCVARLSGVGMDTLFIGVMRHSAAAGSLDNQIVKVRGPAYHTQSALRPSQITIQ